MKGLIERRRAMMVKLNKVPALEYPDAFMGVFTKNAGQVHNFMYGAAISRYILDGVEVIPQVYVRGVTPTTDGRHVLYFWLGSADRINDFSWSGGFEYLRIPSSPAMWHPTFVHNVGGLTRLDFLGDTPPTMDGQFGNHLPNIAEIRVPTGAKSAYLAAFATAGGNLRNKESIIIETNDFSYTI